MLQIGERFYCKAKHRLKNGEKLLGAWAQLASPISAEIIARAGFDFIVVDMEHAPGNVMTLIAQVQGIKGYGAEPFVRAPWNDFVSIKRILDAGVFGIHIPYVNTAAEAEAAVKAVRYPPRGIRGVAGSPRAVGYSVCTDKYLNYADEEIVLMVAIETPQAIENLSEILEVDGVDGIFIGPMDLSTSLGHMGDLSHPVVKEAIAEIEGKVLKSNKFLGTIANDFEAAQKYFNLGYQYIVAFTDSGCLAKQSYNLVQKFRNECVNG